MSTQIEAERDMSRAVIHENPAIILYAEGTQRVQELPQRRLIQVTSHAEELLFTVMNSPSEMPRDAGSRPIPGGREIIRTEMAKIESAVKSVSAQYSKEGERVQDRMINLAGYGEMLFKKLLPEALQKIIKTWPTGSRVTVSTNENWIPWELLHDGDKFLSIRFEICRLPRLPFDQNANNAQSISARPGAPSTGDRTSVHVIGGDLEHYVGQCKGLVTSAAPSQITLVGETLTRVLKEIKDVDLIHLTCHGYVADPMYLQVSNEKDPNANLQITTIRSWQKTENAKALTMA